MDRDILLIDIALANRHGQGTSVPDNQRSVGFMTQALTIATYAAALSVLVVLLAGLWNMLRAGSANASQKLMRWRIGLQFLAICIAMLVFYIAKS